MINCMTCGSIRDQVSREKSLQMRKNRGQRICYSLDTNTVQNICLF